MPYPTDPGSLPPGPFISPANPQFIAPQPPVAGAYLAPGQSRIQLSAAYLGANTRVYPQYRDLVTGLTLTVNPGGIYSFTPVEPGGVPAVPSDGRWAFPLTD